MLKQPAQDNQDNQEAGALGIRGQSERAGFARPREKIGQEKSCSLQVFNSRGHGRQNHSFVKDAQEKDEKHQ